MYAALAAAGIDCNEVSLVPAVEALATVYSITRWMFLDEAGDERPPLSLMPEHVERLEMALRSLPRGK